MTEDIKNNAPNEEAVADTEVNTDAEDKKKAEHSEKDNEKKKKQKKLEAELAAKEKELAEANARIAELDNKYLRLYAEYENFRKRSAKEKENIYADACADALTAILPIGDTLERAANADGDAEQMKTGVKMILKSFNDTLDKLGVKEMDCVGKEFDPNLQNAVMHIEDEGYGDNEVVEVLMKGYERDGRVIRHAMVKVAN